MKCLVIVIDVQVPVFATVVIQVWIAQRVDPLTFCCGPMSHALRIPVPKKKDVPMIVVVVVIVISRRENVFVKFGELVKPVKKQFVPRTMICVCVVTRSGVGNVRKGTTSIQHVLKMFVVCVLNLIQDV